MSLEALIDSYCACWADMEGAERLVRLKTLLTEDAFYHDPSTQIVGATDFELHIAAVVKERSRARIMRTTQVDLHHKVARFGWHLVLADGITLPEGIDIVWLNSEQNLLSGILGFFGPLKHI